MSSIYIFVCRACRSYRTNCVHEGRCKMRFVCESCGERFTVYDPADYVRQNPPDLNRCPACDWKDSMELVEQGDRHGDDPDAEIVDHYQCGFCGQQMHNLVRPSPGVAYD